MIYIVPNSSSDQRQLRGTFDTWDELTRETVLPLNIRKSIRSQLVKQNNNSASGTIVMTFSREDAITTMNALGFTP